MTKITTDFVGTESTVVTKSRLTQILAYWGASTAGYTTWGQARTDLNVRLLNTTAGVIGNEELAGSFLPKINFLNDPDSMVLTALFGAGEQGVWFDPSDVANIDWRRNLLTQTENLTLSGGWSLTSATSVGGATDPDAGATAFTLTATANNANILRASNANMIGTQYVNSFYIRRVSGSGAVSLYRDTGAETVITLTSSWARYSVTWTATGVNGYAGVKLAVSGDVVEIWHPQQELGSVATEYQLITDLNTEIIARFPSATMYQDFSGTTPVYAPNQPVGLRLDKSKGLALGPELVVNGNFSAGLTGWSLGASVTASIVSGELQFTGAGAPGSTGNNWVYQSIFGQVFPSRRFQIVFDATWVSGGDLYVASGYTPTNSVTTITPASNAGVKTRYTRTLTNAIGDNVPFDFAAASGAVWKLDNVSVKEVLGTHATQSTVISRPLYGIEPAGGRRNLLTYSEEFDNAVWTKIGATVVANSTTAPDGTNTADRVTENNAGGQHNLEVTPAAIATTAYTASAYFKRATGVRDAYIQVNNNGGGDAGAIVAIFDLSTGGSSVSVLVPGFTNVTAIAVPVGTSGWYRCSVSLTTVVGTTTLRIMPGIYNASRTYTGDGTSGIFVWGAQLELNTAATPYQKVVSDYEVTEAGVQTCHYCNYDGTNDWMVTNSINFTATDKMSVFAAVRKLGSTVGTIAELSANVSSNNGSFLVLTEGAYYDFYGKGTSLAGRRATTYTAPIANTFSVIYDISQPTGATEIVPKVNGVTPTLTPLFGDMGTGNFGNYPLYIGRRGGASEPFNGRDYGIIISGKLATSTQIGNAENFLLNKLGSLAPVITGVPTIGVN